LETQHIIGYEHTFISTLGDFLKALALGESKFPDFYDAVRGATGTRRGGAIGRVAKLGEVCAMTIV